MWIYRGTPRFRKWLELEYQKEKILQAVESGNFPVHLLNYLSTAFWGTPSKWFEKADWEKLFLSFYHVLSHSPKLSFPILSPSHEKHKDESWDYDGRTWHLYSHLLAKTYGWTLEYISQLQVEEALGKLEEIQVDEQLEQEFYYGLSETAYIYDKRTKTTKFNPLPRPHWMRPKIQEIKKFKMPASILPTGVDYSSIPEEYRPKEI